MVEIAVKDELERIVELKLKMFKEAGIKEILSTNAAVDILKVYKELYVQNKMRH